MRLTIEELEAERGDVEPFEVDFGDETFALPHPADIPFERLVSFAPSSPRATLRALLGDEGVEKMLTKPGMTPRILERILVRYNAHFGLGSLGEGDASPGSSKPAARRSKRTSGSRPKDKAS